MNKIKNIIYVLLTMEMLYSCQDLVFEKKVVDEYYLIATDAMEDMSLCYKFGSGSYVGVVDQSVFAVGFNSQFLIIKQHPFTFPDSINRNKTNYYIITIKNIKSKYKAKESLIGPLNEKEFSKQREILSIPSDLVFTIIFEENR